MKKNLRVRVLSIGRDSLYIIDYIANPAIQVKNYKILNNFLKNSIMPPIKMKIGLKQSKARSLI